MINVNNKLIVLNNSLSVIENQLTIGNKILLSKNRKSEVVDFLIKFTIDGGINNCFNAFVFVSNQYPLSLEMIDRYQTYLDFNHLSMNTNINWFEGLIDLYLDEWNWKKLSSNVGLPLSVKFIQKYQDYWDWKELCSNENLPWNKEFIQIYMENILDWDIADVIASNKGLKWTEELISLFELEEDSDAIVGSLLYSDTICEGHFLDGYNFINKGITYYTSIDKHHFKTTYSLDVLENLDNTEICWCCLCRSINYVDENFLISNSNRIIWHSLSENKVCLTEEIIEKFKDKLSWSALSSNEKLPWSIDFIKKFEDYWDWKYLSLNEGIPWSEDLIDTFIDKWDWDWALSINPKIPISVNFINKYINSINLLFVFSDNNGNFWTEEFIDYFENHTMSHEFSSNKCFPWSIKMIKRFKRYLCNNFIHEKVINEILPFLDDENVAYIFDKIIDSKK